MSTRTFLLLVVVVVVLAFATPGGTVRESRVELFFVCVCGEKKLAALASWVSGKAQQSETFVLSPRASSLCRVPRRAIKVELNIYTSHLCTLITLVGTEFHLARLCLYVSGTFHFSWKTENSYELVSAIIIISMTQKADFVQLIPRDCGKNRPQIDERKTFNPVATVNTVK